MAGRTDSARSALPTRHQALLLLHTPRCAREIRERIPGARRKRIETTLHRLAVDRLIRPVTRARQSRLYERTFLGELLAQDLGAGADTRLPKLSPEEFEVRAWVQAGAYRRQVLRSLAEPLTTKQIRRVVIASHERTGAGHVQRTLRDFAARGLAERDADRVWRLTPLGERLRLIELDGLLERPAVPTPTWEALRRGKQGQAQQD